MSLWAVSIADALNIWWHSVGLWPVKARLVMLHVSLKSLRVSVLLLIVVGICCGNAWRVCCGICCGMGAEGMLIVHLVSLLARSSMPKTAELNVDRVTVKEHGQVRSWEGINYVALVMGSSSSSERTGYVVFSCTCRASRPYGDVGSPTECNLVSWLVRIRLMAVSWSTLWGR